MGYLETLLQQVLVSAPNVIGAIVIFIVGYFIAKAIYRLIKALCHKLKIERLAEKLEEIDVIDRMNVKMDLANWLARFFQYVILLFFVIAATDRLGMNGVSDQIGGIITYAPKLFSALVILFAGAWLSNFIKNVVYAAMSSLNIPSASIIANVVFYFLFISIALSALNQAEIDTSFLKNNLTLILGGAIAAFAIGYGFASRDMMSNFLGSVYSRNKISVGDVISVGNIKGEVVAMDNTSLTLQTKTCQVIVPLHKITAEMVEKYNDEILTNEQDA